MRHATKNLARATFLACAAITAAAAADTGFTYQGRLTHDGEPANDDFDMAFGLWDAVAGGSLTGPIIDILGVSVTDGRFSVGLDFGAAALGPTTGGRWLEIDVEGATLAPRQQIRAAPYSVSTRGIEIADDGNVGIRTATPEATLHVADGTAGDVTAYPGSIAVFERGYHAYLSFLTPDNTERGLLFGDPESYVNGGLIYNSSGAPNGLDFRTGGNRTRMMIDANGNTRFMERLGVYGLGNSGQMAIIAGPTATSALETTSTDDSAPTISVANLDEGPALHVDGPGDVSLQLNSGNLLIGEVNGPNMAMDGNEIMARYNGLATTLHLNADGDQVKFGPNRIHGPFAYVSVAATGFVRSSSGNVDVVRSGVGSYRISIDEGVDFGDVIIVAPRPAMGAMYEANAMTLINLPENVIRVRTYGESDNIADCSFSLLVYRP